MLQAKKSLISVNLTHNLQRPVLRQTPFRFVVVIAFEVEKSQRGILGRGREKLTELQERSNY
jgi:hypothetical protein